MALKDIQQVIVSSDSATELVTTAEVKSHLRIDHTDEDTLIGELRVAARQMAEEYTRRSFITKTLKLYMTNWPDESVIQPPRGRVLSVVGIDYAVSAAHDTEVDSSNYNVGLEGDYCIIDPNDSWPDTDTDFPNGIEVEYTAGYGANVSDVPQAIKNAVLILAADLYEARKSHTERQSYEVAYNGMKPVWQLLLDPYRLF